jgi:hypothetical protein
MLSGDELERRLEAERERFTDRTINESEANAQATAMDTLQTRDARFARGRGNGGTGRGAGTSERPRGRA